MQNNLLSVIAAWSFMFISKCGIIFANIYTWHFPPIFMEFGQYMAWLGVAITTLIAVLNYFGIKWNPFKKKHKK